MKVMSIRFALYLALALTLVWIFWYGLYSTIVFFRIQVNTDLPEPALTRPALLPSGEWVLTNTSLTANRQFENASIPRILHQAFRSEMVYANYLPMINSCLQANPDWKYVLWRDSDAEALIADKYPSFLARYRSYKDNLERADSIRYIVLHQFGGIYLDMDVECKRPFFPALSRLPAFLDQERSEQSRIYWSNPYFAMNSVMGSVPRHPFFQFVIDAMLRHSHIGNALDSTGPRMLTQAYTEYSDMPGVSPVPIMEPRVFSPLMDLQNDWWQICAPHFRSRDVSHPASGCRTLANKNWRMDDSDNATLAVHRFLHLGYNFQASSRRHGVNLTEAFPDRVNLYPSAFR